MDNFVKLDLNDLLGCINGKDQEGNAFKVIDPPYNPVKDEFNKFVTNIVTERREHSTVSVLRKFHNFIKRILIINVANLYWSQHPKEEISLLDIAVGRGGDMFKWNEVGIKNVFGFDKNESSINSINPFDPGAKERYAKAQGIETNIEYFVGDAMQPNMELMRNIGKFMEKHNLINKKNPELSGFQIMSCQFAMHYFFQSEIALRNVLGTFSRFLKKGGFFIGTTVDGKNITDLLKKDKSFNSDLLTITKKYTANVPKKPFGNAYTFKINDTFDKGNYFNSMGESTEYLVNLTELIRIASEYKLIPVYFNLFRPIPDKKNEYASTPEFVSFKEIYPSFKKGKLSSDEEVINNLYSTFVFVKV